MQQQLSLRPGTRPRRPYQAPRLIRQQKHEEREVLDKTETNAELEEFLRQFQARNSRP